MKNEKYPYKKALERMSRLCSRQEKSSGEVRQKLRSWGVPEDDAEKILQALEEQQFVDDGRYARAYARDRHRFRKWGRIKIRMMLRQKQIPEDLIGRALEDLDEREYRETLKAELLAKYKSVKAGNRYDLMARLQRFGVGKGYEKDLVNKTIQEILDD